VLAAHRTEAQMSRGLGWKNQGFKNYESNRENKTVFYTVQ
jgi:hypothetical protein